MKGNKNFKGKAIYNPSGKAGEYSYWACNSKKHNKINYIYEIQKKIDDIWDKIKQNEPPRKDNTERPPQKDKRNEISQASKEKKPKPFLDCLHHENKEALMKKLHELLDNSIGKTVALTIKALMELGYIAGYESKNKLYRAMEKEFGNIGNHSGLNSYLSESSHKLNKDDIEQYKKTLEAVK